ncbi:UDP-N-acetylmuramoyl-L-alanyl-D-glutamate--2,6-diaminopimelate ligase [Paenisporosarcina cavernae]|uniref:UDP-N-acetylmuramoyl-L-alanyl-D-glutamate--2, 6-diaminopimelate ligase n=1 Tax=Paenisporosarcina cavernae TaxID=2320858 RepID=UPI0013C44B94|nr:UDP-N-acetylmuramoyl-L-alanyl-D-glutamate--2,6-diaminopimelate ligase [Paenisporosarcina cavernae]
MEIVFISELLKNWPCDWKQGNYRQEVNRICSDSRDVQKGDMFVAIDGKKVDGHDFVHEAIVNGADCIVVEKELAVEFFQNEEVAVCIVPNTKKFYAYACAAVRNFPSQKVKVIAVTGTNGKTTTCAFISQLLTQLGVSNATIGTNGCYVNQQKLSDAPKHMTTWDANELQQMISVCVDRGIAVLIMEASSIGLENYRLDGCDIDIGVGLAINHDHIDEHGSIEKYIHAKLRLLELATTCVVDFNDNTWFQASQNKGKDVRFFRVEDYEMISEELTNMTFVHLDSKVKLNCRFSGEHLTYDVIAAISALKALGYSLEEIGCFTPTLALPEGRSTTQEVNGVYVVIDYAHTPKALQETLKWCAKNCQGKLITVFGCGGDRDRQKRAMMGEIGCYYSQYLIITSDNPRTEDPMVICQEIVGTLPSTNRIEIIVDRKTAIERALKLANENDVVVVAGKGHEMYQQIGVEKIPFSDFQVVEDFKKNHFLL